MASERLKRLWDRGFEAFRRFLVMFVYLWMACGLFVLNESLILQQETADFAFHGFALLNAAVLGKVMLVAEELRLGRRLEHLPLIYPVTYKAALLSTVFIAFHVLEHLLLGALAGKPLADAVPKIGGGTWRGGLTVWAIMAISLLPFFALREIGRVMGDGWLWNLMFRQRSQVRSAAF